MRLHKTFITLIVLFGLSVICNAQSKKEYGYIILTGRIDNIQAQRNGKKTVVLNAPFYLKNVKPQTIALAENGSFTDTIRTGEGLYYIFDNRNAVPVYLRNSNRYSISYNAGNFGEKATVTLLGADTAINRYFIEKMQHRVFVDRENTGRSEESFRQEMSKIREDQLSRLNKVRLPEKLRIEETKDIQYLYLSELYFFLIEKAQDFPTFKPSMVSEKELNINYNDEAEYMRQPYYSKLVDLHYSGDLLGRVNEHNEKSDSNYSPAQNVIRLLDSLVSNQYIKNDLIKQYARFNLKEAPDKKSYYDDFKKYYSGNDEVLKEEVESDYLWYSKLQQGTPSPEFSGYLNYNGGNNSLKDFRGKYVYIDIWATWCGNCWVELPFLKKTEEKYKDKNIVFVSLSWDKFENIWRQTIKKQKLEGIQLLAGDSEDAFFKKYAVNGIPRYIFVDPNGNIVDYNAPRPSQKEALVALFESVGL